MNQKQLGTDYTDDTVNMDYAPVPLREKAPTAVFVIRHLSSYVKLRPRPAVITDLPPPWVLEVGGPRSGVAGIGSMLETRTRQSASLHHQGL